MNEIRFDIGFLDLWTLLFVKKRCPTCGERMVRRTEKRSTGPRMHWEVKGLGLRGWYGDRTDVKLFYECDRCRRRVSLSQLRHRVSGDPVSEPANEESGR